MNSGQITAILIVAIVMIAMVLRGPRGSRLRRNWQDAAPADDPEKQRLREEVQALKERVAVLERIATDKSSSLEREIEQLRDR